MHSGKLRLVRWVILMLTLVTSKYLNAAGTESAQAIIGMRPVGSHSE